MKRTYLKFLPLALISAFFFEEVPRIIMGVISNTPINHVWIAHNSIPPVLWNAMNIIWYTVILSAAYLLFFKKMNIKGAVIFGIVVGLLAEAFIFHQLNAASIFLFPVLYGLMFYIPFRLLRNSD